MIEKITNLINNNPLEFFVSAFIFLIISLFALHLLQLLIEGVFLDNQYRLIEEKNVFHTQWLVQKKKLFGWTEYFGRHSDDGASFFDQTEAEKWFEFYSNNCKNTVKILKQS